MQRVGWLPAIAGAVLVFGTPIAGAITPARHPRPLEQACVLEGRSDGALLRGQQSPNYAPTIQQVFSTTTDPTAKTAAAAEARFVQLVTSGPLKLSISQLVNDDPISGYCRAVYPAAYFSGSRIVSTACRTAMAALAAPVHGSTPQQRVADARETLTACSSMGEWTQAAHRYAVSRLTGGGASRGVTISAVLKGLCARNGTSPTCAAK
jgi:hypothetical protein